jgi:hypothetical protein
VLICYERKLLLVLVAGSWFVLREKYWWLVADKPSKQGVVPVGGSDRYKCVILTFVPVEEMARYKCGAICTEPNFTPVQISTTVSDLPVLRLPCLYSLGMQRAGPLFL